MKQIRTKIKIAVIVMMGMSFLVNAQTLSEKQRQNARATGYAIIASKNPGIDFSVYVIPWDGVNSLEYNANNQINSGWHAQAVVKGNYFNQSFDGSDFSLYSSVITSQNQFDKYKEKGTQWWIICSTLPPFSEKITEKRKQFNTLVGNNYVKIYQIATKSGQLASNVRVSATSHTGNHVGNFTADILVNHHKDVYIKTVSGGYTQGTIKIESNDSGNYFMSYKTTSPNQGKYYFTVEALSSEITITPLPTGQATTNTVHEHKTNFGTHESGTGGSFNSIFKGSVGIGTNGSSFPDKLTVAGNVNIGANGQGSIKVRHINGKDYNSADFSNLYLNYGTGTNVIIGRDTKDSDLHVYGNIATYGKIESKEIKVTKTPTADFVFEENYNLPTLTSIEKHIKEKKHLPEISSAKEMEKNGVNIGNFQIQLLQKIEELTLYTIEQEKKIKKLEKQNSKIEELEMLVQKLLKDKN